MHKIDANTSGREYLHNYYKYDQELLAVPAHIVLMYNFNVKKLYKKSDEFLLYANQFNKNPDIMYFIKTWLNEMTVGNINNFTGRPVSGKKITWRKDFATC